MVLLLGKRCRAGIDIVLSVVAGYSTWYEGD